MAKVTGVSDRSSRAGRVDGGAVAIEALLVAPVLILMSFGMIDLTLLIRDHLAVTSLAREGARTASAEPRVPAFTLDATDAIARSARTLPLDNRVRIFVYDATTSGSAPADVAACTAWRTPQSKPGCVAYALDPDTGKFVVSGGSWNPTDVNACIGDAGAHYVGVAVRTTHDWLIGLAFPSSGPGVVSRTVMKFELLSFPGRMPRTSRRNARGRDDARTSWGSITRAHQQQRRVRCRCGPGCTAASHPPDLCCFRCGRLPVVLGAPAAAASGGLRGARGRSTDAQQPRSA